MSPSAVASAQRGQQLRRRQQQQHDEQLLHKRNSECQPSHCKPQCQPACSSSERCILDVMKNCGQCPVSQCVSLSALGISTKASEVGTDDGNAGSSVATANNADGSSSGDGGGNRTGLIAGLTTGLVVGAVIVVTIAGLVYYKRKRRSQQRGGAVLENGCADGKPQQQLLERVPTTATIAMNKPLGPPPAAAVLPATTTLPSDTTFWPKEAPPSSPQSPVFMGNTLQIPRLTTTPSSPPPSSTTASSNTIRQSLSLVPSTSTTMGTTNSSLLQRPSPAINRSSSVKLTKYDHRRAHPSVMSERRRAAADSDDIDDEEEDEELGDRVQLRRAVSVNKKQGLSRSASLGARTTTGETVPIVYARPTMVRINTITRKEGGITRKASVRTVISSSSAVEQQPPLQPNNDDQRRLRTESWNSQHSIANSAHSSVGDGEITVYWDSPPNRQQPPPQ